jgi:hypothetical protein
MHQGSILLLFSFQENSNEPQNVIKKDKDPSIDVFKMSQKSMKQLIVFLEPKKLLFLLSFFKETCDVIGDQIHKSRC